MRGDGTQRKKWFDGPVGIAGAVVGCGLVGLPVAIFAGLPLWTAPVIGAGFLWLVLRW